MSQQKVAVVTDSTANFPEGMAEKLNIRIVPLTVRFGGDEYIDNVTLTSDEFYSKLKTSPVFPITSQPSPETFLKVFKEIGGDFNEVISIHISSALSGTVNSAQRPQEQLPTYRIKVVDSLSLSFGLGWLAIRAAEMAEAGASLDAIVAEMETLKPKLRICAAFDTLKYLEKGGRIGKVQCWVGSLLQTKPIIKIDGEGKVAPVSRPRTKKNAIAEMFDNFFNEGEMARVAVIHTAALDEAVDVAKRLKGNYPNLEIPIGQLCPTLGTHSGPGLVGICGLLK